MVESISNNTREIIIDLLSGWASGAVSIVAFQPIDTILTRLQTQTGSNLFQSVRCNTSISRTSALHISNNLFRTAKIDMKSLVSFSGVTSLWRGSLAMITAIPFQNALLMSGYGIGKRWSESYIAIDGKNHHRSHKELGCVFLGGTLGGILQSFLMSPVELVKVRQQVIGLQFQTAVVKVTRGALSFGSHFHQGHSPLLWSGFGATLLRDGIPHGVWFVTYDVSKSRIDTYLKSWNDDMITNKVTSIISPLTSGALSAAVAWGVGYPFDIVKTQIQAHDNKKKGISSTLKELMMIEKGRPWVGLYRGFTLKLLRAVPASAINFTVYEYMSTRLQQI